MSSHSSPITSLIASWPHPSDDSCHHLSVFHRLCPFYFFLFSLYNLLVGNLSTNISMLLAHKSVYLFQTSVFLSKLNLQPGSLTSFCGYTAITEKPISNRTTDIFSKVISFTSFLDHHGPHCYPACPAHPSCWRHFQLDCLLGPNVLVTYNSCRLFPRNISKIWAFLSTHTAKLLSRLSLAHVLLL